MVVTVSVAVTTGGVVAPLGLAVVVGVEPDGVVVERAVVEPAPVVEVAGRFG